MKIEDAYLHLTEAIMIALSDPKANWADHYAVENIKLCSIL